jgi:hypothetical protein
VPRVDLDPVPEPDQAPEGGEETFCPLPRFDREVGPGSVTDEERVPGQDEPGIVTARTVDDCETAVLGSVPRRVDAAEHHVAERYLVSVLEGVVRVLHLSGDVNADGNPVLERETSVPGEVIGVRVRLDRPDDARAALLGLQPVLLDREGWIDDGRDPRVLVTHEVGGAPEVVVDELREDHNARDGNTCPAIPPEVTRAVSSAFGFESSNPK